jgi:hypothetical protein
MGNFFTKDNQIFETNETNETIEDIKKDDRIVEINGFRLFVHDDFRTSRRNIKCHSEQLQSYITLNNYSNMNLDHIISVGELLHENNFNDIKLISVDGFY